MNQFAVVLRELKKWLTSFPVINLLLPYSLYLMFGGVGIQFLRELLEQILPYSSYHGIHVLFDTIPLSVIGYYAFFVGLWLTLISPSVPYVAYGLWAYAFVTLFPFEYLNLLLIVRAVIYVVAGYLMFRYAGAAPLKRGTSRPFSG